MPRTLKLKETTTFEPGQSGSNNFETTYFIYYVIISPPSIVKVSKSGN